MSSMKKKFKVLAVVSARSGSKGVPNKNIKYRFYYQHYQA